MADPFQSPRAVFTAALTALNAEAWDSMPDCVDPISLRGFSRELVERVIPPREFPAMTVEDHLAHDSQMPRTVAEYHVAQAAMHNSAMVRLAREFPGISSVEALTALTPEAVFARWLEGKSMRGQFKQLVAAGQIAHDVAVHRENLPFNTAYEYVVLGTVLDGESVAHIVYRPSLSSPDTWTGAAGDWFRGRVPDEQGYTRDLSGREHPWTAACRRQPDQTWRLVAGHDFLHIASIHLSGVGMRSKETDAAAP